MIVRAIRAILFLLPVVSLLAAEPTPRQLIENGHYRRARAALETRLQAAPDDPEALSLSAHLKLLAGERDAALPLAERAVKLDAKNPVYQAQLAQVLAEMVNHAGAVQQIKLGNQMKAALQAALALDPNNIDALLLQHSIYRNAPAYYANQAEIDADLEAEEREYEALAEQNRR